MLNGSYTKTKVKTDRPRTIIVDGDSIQLAEKEAVTIVSERSREPRTIVVLTGDRVDYVGLRPYRSGAYTSNILTYGLGFIFDGSNIKTWGYQRKLYLTDKEIKRNMALKPFVYATRVLRDNSLRNSFLHKNTWAIRASLPWVNGFSFTDGGHGRDSDVGFMGFSLGADYYYRDKTFVNFTASAIANIFTPFPAAVDISGLWQHKYSIYGAVTHNHMLGEGCLSLGYGLSAGRDTWNTVLHTQWMDGDDPRLEQDLDAYRRSTSLGLATSAYYYTKRQFYIGAVYRPMLWRFDRRGAKFQYQHTFSIDLGWRFRLGKEH